MKHIGRAARAFMKSLRDPEYHAFTPGVEDQTRCRICGALREFHHEDKP